MKRIVGAALALAALYCPPAAATIIDFEGLSPGSIGSAYSEDGYALEAMRPFRASDTSGSIALQGPNPFDFSSSPRISLSRIGGGEFILHSMLVFAADGNGLGVPLAFTARKRDGSTISYTAELPEYGWAPIPETQTVVTFPLSFQDIVSVSWQDGAEFHQFDDIMVSPAVVPEPAGWMLIIFGLGCLALWRSRARVGGRARSPLRWRT